MYGEFWVGHSALEKSAIQSRLVATFSPDDRRALSESTLFRSGKWDDIVLYSTQMPSYRMVCFASHDEELQIYVEPVSGNILPACDSVWLGTKNALRGKEPELSSLRLVDNDSGKEFMSAATGLNSELRRTETLGAIIVGLATTIYAAVGSLTFASSEWGLFLSGAIAGVIGALVALGMAIREARQGTLRWQ